jgi:hypothetical protein
MKPWIWGVLGLAGCGGGDASVVVVEGFGFGWQGFNHRVSHLQYGLDASEEGAVGSATVSVIGGTSTTGVVAELGDACDPDSCDEFPWIDNATIGLRTAEGVVEGSAVTVGSVDLVADSAGVQGEVVVTFDKAPSHDSVFASIVGWTLNTDTPTTDGLEHCYLPKNGWHPQRISLGLGEPVVESDGKVVRVPVNALFKAGNSLEEERVCVDEINEFAAAKMHVTVQVVMGNVQVESQTVDQFAEYAYGDGPLNPEEQPVPTDGFHDLTLPKEDALYGWRSLDWEFHVGDPEGRGAYLRTLSFGVDAEASTVAGHATNYSPGTQLSGFDYHFAGTVDSAIASDIVRRVGEINVPAAFDEAGQPAVNTLPLEAL